MGKQITIGDPYYSFNQRVAENDSKKDREFLRQLRRNKERFEPLGRATRKRFKHARSVPGRKHKTTNHMGQGELFEASQQTGIRRKNRW